MFFFIDLPFAKRGLAGADNPNPMATLCKGNDQQARTTRHTNDDVARKPLYVGIITLMKMGSNIFTDRGAGRVARGGGRGGKDEVRRMKDEG